jgi:hypothetical protein
LERLEATAHRANSTDVDRSEAAEYPFEQFLREAHDRGGFGQKLGFSFGVQRFFSPFSDKLEHFWHSPVKDLGQSDEFCGHIRVFYHSNKTKI